MRFAADDTLASGTARICILLHTQLSKIVDALCHSRSNPCNAATAGPETISVPSSSQKTSPAKPLIANNSNFFLFTNPHQTPKQPFDQSTNEAIYHRFQGCPLITATLSTRASMEARNKTPPSSSLPPTSNSPLFTTSCIIKLTPRSPAQEGHRPSLVATRRLQRTVSRQVQRIPAHRIRFTTGQNSTPRVCAIQ